VKQGYKELSCTTTFRKESTRPFFAGSRVAVEFCDHLYRDAIVARRSDAWLLAVLFHSSAPGHRVQRQPSAHASRRYARSDDSHLNDDIVSDSRAKQAIRDDGRDDGSVARSSYDRLETPLARPVR